MTAALSSNAITFTISIVVTVFRWETRQGSHIKAYNPNPSFCFPPDSVKAAAHGPLFLSCLCCMAC